MLNTENDFFKGKRPWSKLKDQVLEKYLRTYLNIVKDIGKTVILVDSFAGPGVFEDDGTIGSPITICKIADEIVKDNFFTILVNKRRQHHNILTEQLQDYIKTKKAFTIHGSASDLLSQLDSVITNQTIFIYLDPFGLKGTDFNILEKFLQRDQKHSTEILINLSIPTILRYSCLNSISKTGITPRVITMHSVITNALGGDYWKEFLLDQKLSPDERRRLILEEYSKKLNNFLPYIGYCPVYESDEKSTMKYAIFFASRHPKALVIMNDIMLAAYSKQIWKAHFENTLFETANWEENLPTKYYTELEKDILEIVKNSGKIQRKELWQKLVRQKFMRYLEKHFNHKITDLYKNGILDYIDVRKTRKINKDSIMFLK